jgi:uncharacterized repeat protein (TIGR01451 family)
MRTGAQSRFITDLYPAGRTLECLEARWALAGPTVIETSPGAHELSASLESDVAVVFDQAVAALSASPETIVAHSQYTGRLPIVAEDISVDGETANIKLPRSLMPGERLTLTVTAGVKNLNAEGARVFVWEFQATAIGGAADFEPGAALPTSVDTSAGALAVGDFDGDGRLDVFDGETGQFFKNLGAGHLHQSGATSAPLEYAHRARAVDLDNDGDLDVVGASFARAAVWFNDGHGSFLIGEAPDWPHGVVELQFADFDGDGDEDAILAHGAGLSVELNNGAGLFSTRFVPGGMQDHPREFALGDVDNDGDVDFIARVYYGPGATLWLNLGDATFTGQPFPQSLGSRFVDVNGDGLLDLFSNAFLLMNQGGTQFSDRKLIGDWEGARVLSAADFDGDGDQDIMLEHDDDQELMLNDGQGGFIGTGVKLPLSSNNSLISSVGDIDGDGDLDLLQPDLADGHIVYFNRGSSVDLSVYVDDQRVEIGENASTQYEMELVNRSKLHLVDVRMNVPMPAGLAQVTWATTASAGSSAPTAGTGAIDHLVNLAPGGRVTYAYRGTITGIAGSAVALRAVATPPTGVVAGIDSANLAARGGDLTKVVVVATSGSGFLRYSGVELHGSVTRTETADAEFADLDGDGDQDAVLVNWQAAGEIWVNDGAGQYMRDGQSIGATSNGSLALADWEGDGDVDIFVSQEDGDSSVTRVWTNNGSGVFSRSAVVIPFTPIVLLDLNGDGALDALVNDVFGGSEIMLGAGAGEFVSTGQRVAASAMFAGDLDGDGDWDLISTQLSSRPRDDGTVVWLNNGHGHFAPKVERIPVSQFAGSAFGDVDDDGDIDWMVTYAICWSCTNGGWGPSSNQIWLNDGHGEFSLSDAELPRQQSHRVDLQDFDGDGDLDAFVANMSQFQFDPRSVWLNDGSGTFRETAQTFPENYEHSYGRPAFADMDQDGDIDVLYYGTNDPELGLIANRIWLNETNYAEIAVTNTDHVASLTAGVTVTYTVSVANHGTIASNGVTVTQSLSSILRDVRWTSETFGGAVSAAEGVGAIADVIDLPANATVVYYVKAKVAQPIAEVGDQSIRGTVLATNANGVFDPIDANNAASDTDSLVIPSAGGGYLGVSQNSSLEGIDFNSGALGDLDGDGDLDLVTGRYAKTILLNDGEGLFVRHATYSFGSTPSRVTLVDIDSDGDLDVAPTMRTFDATASFLENDGHGVFTSRSSPIFSSFDAAFGDLDGDGDIDGIYASDTAGLQLAIQDELWTFRALESTTDYMGATRILLGDYDTDGDLDGLLVHAGASVILQNDGRGYFSEVEHLETQAMVRDVASGDLDGDGFLDFFFATDGADEVWINDGAGQFAAGASLPDAGMTTNVRLADLDGDGDLDALTTGAVWFNNGTGEFSSAAFPFPSGAGVDFAAGDLDNDGDWDVLAGNSAWLNYDGLNDLEVMVTNHVDQLVFGQMVSYEMTVTNYGSNLVSGVPVDSLPIPNLGELTWTSTGTPGTVSTPNGGGALHDRVDLPAAGSITYTVQGRVRDVVGQDLIVGLRIAFPSEVNLYDPMDNNYRFDADIVVTAPIFGGTGRLTDARLRLGTNSNGVAAADLDNDGDSDLVESSADSPTGVWWNDGTGRFANTLEMIVASGVLDVSIADFDGDMDLDLFFVIESAPDRIWFNDGHGAFTQGEQAIGDANSQGVAADVGDFDGNGTIDLVIAEGGSLPSRVWRGDGLGRFQSPLDIWNSSHLSDIAVADVDIDGDLDVVITSTANGGVVATRINTDGVFRARGFGTSIRATSVAVGDIDHDGDQDFAIAVGDGAYMFLNRNDGSFVVVPGASRLTATSIALGDLDGDGDLDLISGRGRLDVNEPAIVWLFDSARSVVVDSGLRLGAAYTASIALADFDGDGDLDAVFGNRANGDGDATSVWLNAAVAGDTAPFDGRVDLVDLNNVRNWFGATGQAASAGDTDSDGDVDLLDLNSVRNAFGASVHASSAALRVSSRPEVRSLLSELALDRTTPLDRSSSELNAIIWQSALEQLDFTHYWRAKRLLVNGQREKLTRLG